MGAVWAGAQVVAAVNHWSVAAASYERNHHVRPISSSVSDVQPEDLPAADVLLFSPECTNHGGTRGAAPRDESSRNQGWDVIRFVRAIRPRAFVVENVRGFRGWERFSEWAAALQDLGYALNRDADGRAGQMLCAADWGVPQARHRLIVVGVRGYEPHIQSPRMEWRPVVECIDWTLPMPRIDSRPRATSTLARIALGRELFGAAPFLTVYYKCGPQVASLDRPCRTVTTRDRFGLVAGDRYRMLQPAELLRIQGFPDSYSLAGTREQQVMQVGNAVPPGLMAGVLEQAA